MVKHDDEEAPVSRKEFVAVLRGVRFAVAGVLLVLSYLNLQAAISIPHFRGIFQDMLNGKPLPGLSVFVLEHWTTIMLFSLLIPAAAVACLLIKRGLAVSFYALAILTLVSLGQLVIVVGSITAPMVEIIQGMSAGQPETKSARPHSWPVSTYGDGVPLWAGKCDPTRMPSSDKRSLPH